MTTFVFSDGYGRKFTEMTEEKTLDIGGAGSENEMTEYFYIINLIKEVAKKQKRAGEMLLPLPPFADIQHYL